MHRLYEYRDIHDVVQAPYPGGPGVTMYPPIPDRLIENTYI